MPPAAGGSGGFSFGKPDQKPGQQPGQPSGTQGADTKGPPAAAPVAAPSLLRGKSMEEIVKMWQDELDASVKEFSRQAGEVAAWDRMLLKGGDDISRLVGSINKAEERQTSVDQMLDYVEQQQGELNTLLDSYENQMGDMLQNNLAASGAARGGDVGVADVERDKAYSLAENLNSQLDDMSRNLSSMIDEVNQLSAPSTGGARTASAANGAPGAGRDAGAVQENPIAQISAILNAHLGSLKWIDEHAAQLRDRLEALRRGQTGKLADQRESLRASSAEPAMSTRSLARSMRESTAAPNLGYSRSQAW